MPKWINCCNHKPEEFIKTIKIPNRQRTDYDYFDVYVYYNLKEPEVCIRYGNDGADYISPGGLLEFATRITGNEIYEASYDAIKECGFIDYKKGKR